MPNKNRDEINIESLRNGNKNNTSAKLKNISGNTGIVKKMPFSTEKLGIKVKDLTKEELAGLRIKNGVIITNITPGLGLPAPNPSPGTGGFVDVALQQDDRVHCLQVLDDQGNTVLTLLDGMELKGGVHRVEFSHQGLPSGVYAIQMMTASGKSGMQRIVVAR